jgi:hypothetical protein
MSNIALHDWSLDMSRATHRVGLAAGAVLAGALIPLLTSPAAGADEGGPGDTAMDQFFASIANFFSPEDTGNMVTADQFSDMFTGEGTAADQFVDAYYLQISQAFAPEGPIDRFFDGANGAQALDIFGGNGAQGLDAFMDSQYQAISDFFSPEAVGNMLTADQISDLFTGEGTMADQMVDNMYQMISTAFAPEGPVDMFFDSLLGLGAV